MDNLGVGGIYAEAQSEGVKPAGMVTGDRQFQQKENSVTFEKEQ